jgi:DNA-binding transcriptional LysR family regulator
MADVDLRKLRYFVAVAERLHFGRAAEALHIAQPVLSRQIKALEDELKAQLLVRDKRATELTPAGRQLLADAGPLLASADALRRRVARAARGPGCFTIGFMPGLIVTEAVRALAGRHPQLTVNVLRTNWDDQTAVLHDGRADVSYIRLPVDQSGLQIQALLAEPRVAVLPAGHRLAGKDTISVADLADEHLLQDPDAVPEWRDIATEMRARRRPSPPVFHTVEEKLEHVAAGHGIVLLPLSTAVFYTRPGVAYSHVSDIPANQVCLAGTPPGAAGSSRTSPPSPRTTRPSPARPNRTAAASASKRQPSEVSYPGYHGQPDRKQERGANALSTWIASPWPRCSALFARTITSRSWWRSTTPSLGKDRYKCELTVRGERNSRSPISRLVRPSLARRTIWRC